MPSDDEDEEVAYPPWNFSWIVEGQLAGMAYPRTGGNMRYVAQQGIKHLVTLSPEKIPPVYETPDIEWTKINVDEFEAPSIKQIKQFIEICQRCNLRNKPVGMHCRQGLGRTGVMAACYLVNFQGLTPERAIINVRLRRPGSIETYEQEQMVVKYHDYIRGVKGTY